MKRKLVYLIAAVSVYYWLIIIAVLSGSAPTTYYPPLPPPAIPELSITLLSPNGGEVWEKGESGLINNISHRPMIKWRINGTFQGEDKFAVVKLRKENGTAKTLFAVPIFPPWDKPEHCWSNYSVPEDVDTGDYKIEIIPVVSEKMQEWNISMKEIINGTGDASDHHFSIVAATNS